MPLHTLKHTRAPSTRTLLLTQTATNSRLGDLGGNLHGMRTTGFAFGSRDRFVLGAGNDDMFHEGSKLEGH